MQNNDSFNDSDEIFNLYSSKNIKETFKAQCQKLFANKPVVSSLNNCNQNDKNHKEYQGNASFEIVNSSPISKSSGDFVQVLNHSSPKKSIRRSQRLRNKRSDGEPAPQLSKGDKILSKRKIKKKNAKSSRHSTDDIITLDSSDSAQMLDEDELNPELSVKIIWKSVSIKKFKIRKFQKFAKIFEELAKEENVPEEKIILTFNSVRINKNDTPELLNLQLYHFIDGGVLSELTNCNLSNFVESILDINLILIKFQDVNKKIFKISLRKNDMIKVGMIKYSEQSEIPLEKLKFYFDGELLNPLESPASLNLENNEVIDVKFCC